MHQIHQQYSNYTDSGQILKEIVLFEPHCLKFILEKCHIHCHFLHFLSSLNPACLLPMVGFRSKRNRWVWYIIQVDRKRWEFVSFGHSPNLQIKLPPRCTAQTQSNVTHESTLNRGEREAIRSENFTRPLVYYAVQNCALHAPCCMHTPAGARKSLPWLSKAGVAFKNQQ